MSRRRALLGINLVSFFWGLGMGASIPVIPLLSYQFVPDLALAGIVTAVGGIGALFTGWLSGPLMDRFGRRGVTLWGIGIRTVFSFGEGLAPSYLGLAGARLGSAIGTAVYGTGLSVITADIARPEDRGAISGSRQTLAQIGQVLGPVAGGVIWAATGDIRMPFIFNGVCKMVCFVVFLWVMRETQSVAPAERTPAGAPVPHASVAQPSLRSILLTGAFAFAAYVVFLESLIRQAILNVVLPVYVQKELGRSETELGLIVGAVSLGGLLMAFPAGRLADRWGVHIGVIAGALVAAAPLVMTGLTGYIDPLLAGLLGAGTALFFIGGQAFAIDLAPPHARGQFFGVRSAASNLAIFIGPLIVGKATDVFGYAFPFLFVAAMVLSLAPMALAARVTYTSRR